MKAMCHLCGEFVPRPLWKAKDAYEFARYFSISVVEDPTRVYKATQSFERVPTTTADTNADQGRLNENSRQRPDLYVGLDEIVRKVMSCSNFT